MWSSVHFNLSSVTSCDWLLAQIWNLLKTSFLIRSVWQYQMVQPVITYDYILVAFNICARQYQYIQGIVAVVVIPIIPIEFQSLFSIDILPLIQQAFSVRSWFRCNLRQQVNSIIETFLWILGWKIGCLFQNTMMGKLRVEGKWKAKSWCTNASRSTVDLLKEEASGVAFFSKKCSLCCRCTIS